MLGVVYKITCMGTGRRYIGRTSNYNSRLSVHFSNLRKGVHDSKLMQNDFNEYGMDSFAMKVLCKGSMDYMGNMEGFMIKFYKPEYNTANVLITKVDSSHGLLCRFSSEWDSRWGYNTPIKKGVVEKVGGGSVGRPRCELSSEDIARGEAMLEMGVSVSVMCRKLGIYRVKWYRAVSGRKKAPTS